MGVRQPADDHFWGERNAVIGALLERQISDFSFCLKDNNLIELVSLK